jgi:hypothetical protein
LDRALLYHPASPGRQVAAGIIKKRIDHHDDDEIKKAKSTIFEGKKEKRKTTIVFNFTLLFQF